MERGGRGGERAALKLHTDRHTCTDIHTHRERERRRQGKKVGEEGRGKVWNSDEAIMPSTAPQ